MAAKFCNDIHSACSRMFSIDEVDSSYASHLFFFFSLVSTNHGLILHFFVPHCSLHEVLFMLVFLRFLPFYLRTSLGGVFFCFAQTNKTLFIHFHYTV